MEGLAMVSVLKLHCQCKVLAMMAIGVQGLMEGLVIVEQAGREYDVMSVSQLQSSLIMNLNQCSA